MTFDGLTVVPVVVVVDVVTVVDDGGTAPAEVDVEVPGMDDGSMPFCEPPCPTAVTAT